MMALSTTSIAPMKLHRLIEEKAKENQQNTTTEKTNSVWMRYAGYLAFACAAAAVALTAFQIVLLPVGVVATVLFLAMGAYAITRGKPALNYADPEVLKQVREEATKLSLNEVVDKHGWENIFTHKVLSPADFKTKFCKQAEEQSFKKSVTAYDEAHAAREKVEKSNGGKVSDYEIPSLDAYLSKWAEEVVKADFSTLPGRANLCDLDKLVESHAISSEAKPYMEQVLVIKKAATPREALVLLCDGMLDDCLAEATGEIQEKNQEEANHYLIGKWQTAREVASNPGEATQAIFESQEENYPDWLTVALVAISSINIHLFEHPKLKNFDPSTSDFTKAEMIQIHKDVIVKAKLGLDRSIEPYKDMLPKETSEMLSFAAGKLTIEVEDEE